MAGALEKNLASLARLIDNAVAGERWAHAGGWLQSVDPRIKLIAMPCAVLACALTARIWVLALLSVVAVMLAGSSRVPPGAFIKRVWIFIPLFTGVVAIPAIFLTPGRHVASIGPLAVTREGLAAAAILITRVAASVSFVLLIALTTPWNDLLSALRRIRIPGVIVSLLSVSYRYFRLLLRVLIELLTARASRVISPLPYRMELAFLSRSAGFLFLRSLDLAEGVHMAMASRGYDGTADLSGAGDCREDTGRIPAEHERRAAVPVFELRDVAYAYPDGTPGVNIERLSVRAGACTCVLGPNGSGKSTLLKILDGLIFPRQGEVRAFGEALTESGLAEKRFRAIFRSRVGLVFQNPDIQCFSPTVREELEFGPTQKGLRGEALDRVVDDAMNALCLDTLGSRYPYRLSGGEKKRVAIASVLTVDPDIYLLDEPTGGLDPATEGLLIDLLAGLVRRRKTLIIATQDLLLARHIGDRAVVLGPDKRIAAEGEAAEVLEQREMLVTVGLLHAHRTPHRTMPALFRHSHYTEEGGDPDEGGKSSAVPDGGRTTAGGTEDTGP